MAKSNVFKRGFMAEAERLGDTYRAALGKTTYDALDAFELADHLKVQVYAVDEYLDFIDAVKITGTRSNPKDWSALWMKDEDGLKIIIHNPNHSPSRQQSNVMHELAHIIRNHEVSPEVKILSTLTGLRSYNKLHEEEAKYLGACLQINRIGLLKLIDCKYKVEQIAEYYNASKEMVQFRINATGIGYQRKLQGTR